MLDTIPDWLASIPGANEVIAWFGYWPSFHDAEVTLIELARSDPSRVDVHAFESTEEINAKGQYVSRNHAVVSFLVGGIQELTLTGFNHQNVLSGLRLARVEEGYQLTLEGCYGIDGVITAESLRIALRPSVPPDSQYLTEGKP
jgi:hypothetical protein